MPLLFALLLPLGAACLPLDADAAPAALTAGFLSLCRAPRAELSAFPTSTSTSLRLAPRAATFLPSLVLVPGF